MKKMIGMLINWLWPNQGDKRKVSINALKILALLAIIVIAAYIVVEAKVKQYDAQILATNEKIRANSAVTDKNKAELNAAFQILAAKTDIEAFRKFCADSERRYVALGNNVGAIKESQARTETDIEWLKVQWQDIKKYIRRYD